MSAAFAFLERWGGGAALFRIRLIDARDERVWTAAASALPTEGRSPEPDEVQAAVRDAALWLIKNLGDQGVRGGLTVCLDADAARCAWLTAPNGEPGVVRAAVRAAAFAGGSDDGTGSGGGATPTFWSSQAAAVGVDVSVQALGRADVNGTARAADHRERLAVLSLPDLAARLLLDELDRRGVAVHTITSFWHVAALAWDPARAEALRGGTLPALPDSDPLTQTSMATTAIITVEPSGRLAWAWSRGGALLAAGSMRLRRAAPPGTETALTPSGDGPPAAPIEELQWTQADVGRVVTEWLAWSLQLGVGPQRIVGLGPTAMIGGMSGLVSALAAQWPGATAAATVEDDPVRATLARLAEAFRGGAGIIPESQVIDELASRPNRQTRRLHWWVAGAAIAAALLLASVAWRIERGAAGLREQAEKARTERRTALEKTKDIDPRIFDDPDPVRLIRNRINQFQDTRKQMQPERPVLPVFTRLIEIVEKAPGVRFHMNGKIQVSSMGLISGSFAVPDATAGANFLQLLIDEAGDLGVEWRGRTGTASGDIRRYELSATWESRRPTPPPPTGGPR